MIALICGVAIGLQTVTFTVSHHVVLPDCLLVGSDFRRDGSMVGSYGQMGLHDGAEFPLIVRQGKYVRLENLSIFQSYNVDALLPNRQYQVSKDSQNPVEAVVRGNNLVLLGSMKGVSVYKGVSGKRSGRDESIVKLFPIPAEFRDTAEIESIYWWNYLDGTKLAQVVTVWHMENSYRTAFRDSSGKFRPLEKCIPELANYEVRGIDFVSPDGWFVLDAIRTKPQAASGITIGLGNELFWIEPHVKKANLRL